jgi:CelD/BcsL family acetyltransferase involved in cellulose biosynthesis
VIEITEQEVVHRASTGDAADARPQAATSPGGGAGRETGHRLALAPLTDVPVAPWRVLAERAIEPNGYYLPDWELAVNAFASGRTGASALCAWSETPLVPEGATRLTGLLPVISMWRAYKIPLPALASASPYGTLCTPLLDRDNANDAVSQMMAQARSAGAHALILRDVSMNGAAMKAITEVLRHNGLRPLVLQSHARACLDARRDADELLRNALGGKKLKELRRQRNRLAEHGAISFDVARTPEAVTAAIETFMALEASGWKARRGTALKQDEGDAGFIRRATTGLAASGQCEIVTLYAGETPVAGAIVLRHQDRAFYFKLGVDERFAKFSPGVQLTLELTKHLCASAVIATADSTASADHPMINPIWRGRLKIGDVLIPLRPRDPVVSIIHAALMAHRMVHEFARRAVHIIRKAKSSRTRSPQL